MHVLGSFFTDNFFGQKSRVLEIIDRVSAFAIGTCWGSFWSFVARACVMFSSAFDTGFLLQFDDLRLIAETLNRWFMGFIFFPVYFDILDESNMIYLCKCGSRCEYDSIHRVFSVGWYFNTMYGILALAFNVFTYFG